MKKSLFSLLILCFIGLQSVLAQTREVSGVVTSADDGLSIPGTSVFVKGTSVGTTTDFDGKYSLKVPEDAKTLVFSFVGMTTQEVEITSSTINVVMKSDAISVDEVMVVAYGTAKKSTFTGAATQVKAEELENIPVPTFTEALQGNASGIQVNSASGDPGSGSTIRIRGIGSLNADSGPLYVVDGIVINSGNVSQLHDKDDPDGLAATDVLSTINPSDIESMTVLKDASATSIYGARAANGVVLITTKRGKSGKAKINFDAKLGVSYLPNKGYDLMSSGQYFKHYYDAFRAQGLSVEKANAETIAALSANNPYNVANPYDAKGNLVAGAKLLTNTDWIDKVFRTGKSQEYNLSAAGGTEKTSYFISLGYSDQEGIVGGTNFERISTRINLESELSNRLKVGTNTSLTYTDQSRASASSSGASSVYNALMYANAIPVYKLDSKGKPRVDDKGNKIYNFANPVSQDFNPLYTVENDTYNTKTYRVLSGIYGVLNLDDLVEGLEFRTDESIDFYTVDDFQFYNPFHGNGPSVNGRGYAFGTWNTYWTTSNKLTFDKTINDHHFNVLVGFEASENRERVVEAQATQYAIYGDVVLSELANAAQYESAGSAVNKWSMMSYLARVNYDLKNKYYLSLSWRNDGSSRFGKDKRHGNFFSLGASWRVSEEDFMSDIAWVDNLKLRGSYGTSGNDQVGLYDYITNFSSWNYDGNPGNALYKPGNANLGWEESASLTLGLDYTLFSNRLSGSLEYYNRKTSDLLYKTPISLVSGFSTVIKNSAEMKNYGVEFMIDYRAIDRGDFSWDLGFNITKNENEIVSLPVDQQVNGSKIWKEGGSMHDFYLLKWAGVDSKTGAPLWYKKVEDENGKETGELTTTSNRNSADRFNVGSAQPDFYGGIQNTFVYKNWTLSANVYFSVGGYILDNVEADLLNDGNKLGSQLSKKQLNSWTPKNTNTNVPIFIPRNSNDSNYNLSDRYLYDATYAKLKAVTLSHNFAKNITQKLGVSKLTMYVSGNNLLTWKKDSDFEGFDPEVGLDGKTGYVTPNPRTFIIGVKLGF
ncbi:MAG: SusC/RagA family TonB-linked outer membrane protein [Marinifilaceae bacterium]